MEVMKDLTHIFPLFEWFELETIGMSCVLDLVRGAISVRWIIYLPDGFLWMLH